MNMIDHTPAMLAAKFDREEAEDAAAEDERSRRELMESLIRSLLVRPGSDVDALLCDAMAGETWCDDLYALARRAAGPQDAKSMNGIAGEFCRMVNVAIYEAAAEKLRNGVKA